MESELEVMLVSLAPVCMPPCQVLGKTRDREIFLGQNQAKKPWAEAMAGIQFWVTSFGLDVRASTAYSSA